VFSIEIKAMASTSQTEGAQKTSKVTVFKILEDSSETDDSVASMNEDKTHNEERQAETVVNGKVFVELLKIPHSHKTHLI
jgi:hypothetical protein